MKTTKQKLLVALLFSLTSAGAMADEGNAYGAFDIGQGKDGDFCTGVPATISCSDSTTAYRLTLGYQVNNNIGIEGSYLPEAKITASGTYLGANVTVDGTFSGYQLAAIGSVPLTESFSLLGKAGLAIIDAKTSATATLGAASATLSQSNSNTNFAFGLGARFAINKQVALRVMYEDFGTIKSSSTDTGGKITFMSAGLQVGF